MGTRALRLQPHQPDGWSGPGLWCILALTYSIRWLLFERVAGYAVSLQYTVKKYWKCKMYSVP